MERDDFAMLAEEHCSPGLQDFLLGLLYGVEEEEEDEQEEHGQA